jgi:hypothetical protein
VRADMLTLSFSKPWKHPDAACIGSGLSTSPGLLMSDGHISREVSDIGYVP